MNFPWVNLTAIIVGIIISTIGGILLTRRAFRESLIWGLVVIFAPFGKLIYACVNFEEGGKPFMAIVIGVAMFLAGLLTVPDLDAQLSQLASLATPGSAHDRELAAQIQEHRQRLETLQGSFAQDGTELTRQYQALEAQRKALQPNDAAAITKFNESAAAYQARNTTRKQMQAQIEGTQKELEALLDARSRNPMPTISIAPDAPAAPTKKVVMYTTSHCPACKAARKYLAQKGVPYEEIDVETSPAGAQAFQKLGGHGVPLILVGDKKMQGFDAQVLDAML